MNQKPETRNKKLNDVERAANQELAGIAAARASLDLVQARRDRWVEYVDSLLQPDFARHRDKLAGHEVELNRLMTERTADIFHGKDKAELPNGVLHHRTTHPVKRIRTLRDRIVKLGFWFLLKPPGPPPVNWDAVEALGDPGLTLLGAERRDKEEFEFEVQT